MINVITPLWRAIYAQQDHLKDIVPSNVNVIWVNLEDAVCAQDLDKLFRWYNTKNNYLFIDCTKEDSEIRWIVDNLSKIYKKYRIKEDHVYWVTGNPYDKNYVKHHIFWEMFLTSVKEMIPGRSEIVLSSRTLIKKFVCYNGRNRKWRRELYDRIKQRRIELSPSYSKPELLLQEFEYVFNSFPDDLNTLILLKSVFDKLPNTLEEAEKITMKSNPTLIAARISEDIGKEAINTAKSSLYPTVKGIVSHSEKQDFGGVVGFKRETSAKLDFAYPLNLSLSEYAGKNAAVESYIATSTRIRDQEDMIKQMLRTTWDGLKTAQQNAQFLTNQARISGEFLELARQERQAGNRTLLDVLGGETALINAQADAIAAKIEVLINSYTLMSLMGELSIESIEFVE